MRKWRECLRGKVFNYDILFLKFMRMNIADLHE